MLINYVIMALIVQYYHNNFQNIVDLFITKIMNVNSNVIITYKAQQVMFVANFQIA